MTDQDAQDLKEGVYEIYDEFHSHGVGFLQYDETSNTDDLDIYGDSGDKDFLDPVYLVAKATYQTKGEILSNDGPYQDIDLTVMVPTISLENVGIDTLTTQQMLKSRIQYKGETYRITKFIPSSIVLDIVTKYEMWCANVRRT